MENFHKILGYVRYVIGLMYVALGVYLLVNPESLKHLIKNPTHTMIFGGVIAFYGLFRLYRTYKLMTSSNKNE